ncbi:MAG: DUF362 domain-containing protein [Candidatus Geothermincolia bacterium]
MLPKVYFASAGGRFGQGPIDKIHMLFEAAGFADVVRDRDLVAIKLHFGERGSTGFVKPHYVRAIASEIIARGGHPFLTDTGCLYFSGRSNAHGHLMIAAEHGFSPETTLAPVLIADGLRGSDVTPVEVGLKHFESVDVAGAIHDADSLIVSSHVTGHALTAFAATIKNLGMGAAGRRMKLAVHDMVRPRVDAEKCDLCESCLENCPAGAISRGEGGIEIDLGICYGCGECLAICPSRAISIEWRGDPGVAQEKLCEITAAVLANKKGRVGFFNFLIDVTPTCDCWNYTAAPSVPDIGFMASKDPVAIDQAAADMVMRYIAEESCVRESSAQTTSTFLAAAGTAFARQLMYAEELGLGLRQYELVRVGD